MEEQVTEAWVRLQTLLLSECRLRYGTDPLNMCVASRSTVKVIRRQRLALVVSRAQLGPGSYKFTVCPVGTSGGMPPLWTIDDFDPRTGLFAIDGDHLPAETVSARILDLADQLTRDDGGGRA